MRCLRELGILGTLPSRLLGKRAVLGVVGFATHHLSLEQAPHGYEIFRN